MACTDVQGQCSRPGFVLLSTRCLNTENGCVYVTLQSALRHGLGNKVHGNYASGYMHQALLAVATGVRS